MKLWYKELHMITGTMALHWTPTKEMINAWAERLEKVAASMKEAAK